MYNQSVMTGSHSFAQVPSADIPRSTFNRSHGVKTTLNAGYLVPIFVDEVLPGDTFNLSMSLFGRLATPFKPFMDNLYLETFAFFVPNRLVWSNWEKFCGAQNNPGDTTSFVIPQVPAPATSPNPGGSPATVPGWAVEMLYDYFGVPTGVTSISVDNLHGRAYNLIYNDWFRDENLQNSVTVDLGDGPDTASNYVIRKRGKRHDYFTSALPWPQKGPAVTIPLGTEAAIYRRPNASPQEIYLATTNTKAPTGALSVTAGGGFSPLTQAGPVNVSIDPNNTWYTDLSNATAATINSLRSAASIQRLYERDARGGTRYTEIVLSHFRVRSPDARLQRPEYLGGGSTRINVTPIAQTSAATSQPTPQGNLAAMGTLSAQGHGFVKSFTEHGVIMVLASVRADLNYQQGMHRMWSRQTRFDFYWPDLAQLGEQSVLNKEIYTQGTADDLLVFGYQERHAEYRYKPSVITGKFRSTYSQPLDMWHLAQKFTALPTLGTTFIQDDTTTILDRVITVPGESDILLDVYHQLTCARPMPVFGVPGMTRF